MVSCIFTLVSRKISVQVIDAVGQRGQHEVVSDVQHAIEALGRCLKRHHALNGEELQLQGEEEEQGSGRAEHGDIEKPPIAHQRGGLIKQAGAGFWPR